MDKLILFLNLKDIDKIIFVVKLMFITVSTYYTCLRATNIKFHLNINSIIGVIITIIIAIIAGLLKYETDYLTSILFLILTLGIVYSIINNNEFVYNLVTIVICLSINYILFFIAITLDFFVNIIINLQNDYINLITMMIIHSIILYFLFKLKRFKNGFSFLHVENRNDYFNILILNTSITIIFSFIILKSVNTNSNWTLGSNLILEILILSIITFMTIKKTLTMYYKHKMLVKELTETKEDLEKKVKEIEILEKENLNFSKISHSIAHRQRSLEDKLNKLMINSEFADELNLKDRIGNITKEYTENKAVVELSKTGIDVIDDMLEFMKSECIKNDINFELQLNGNIHYMTNNIVSKDKLEILLADHIKDAIIAIQHSDNINRSILVRLGMIDEFYSLYIYDSGIEFEIDTLVNLGTKPITTYPNEGGTGMGFMNTFDTLNEYKASMIIDEIGKPCKDNYTKVIMIKFDNKNEFKIKSYRSKHIKENKVNNNMELI